ncbi:MAG: hypothetical protein LUE21_05795 [Oscillospiraceae bacterium]|nr:hypothetical protein [Oscillospiraceae bacterium]
MPEASNEAQCFYQNLVDIGFGEDMIARCVLLKKQGRSRELLIALQGGRRTLLANIHTEQKKLDNLDYLIYQLNKKGGTA